MSDAFGQIIADKGLNVPAVVSRFHSASSGRYHGRARVEGGNFAARFLTRLAGFPAPGEEVEFQITTQPQGSGQLWSRQFGRSSTTSHLRFDRVRGCAVERFGLVQIQMGLRMQGAALAVDVLGVSLLGVPLPKWLTPKSASCEFETPDGTFGFDISAKLPVIGLLIRYQGAFEVPVTR
ncbi:MAG: hypothetical protein BM558_11810 [Roseobacter sp. MedPE-SW]|nr:MAG: hypothetical protein BM558_11810 [Roseobacter sp. MedPE-SW]